MAEEPLTPTAPRHVQLRCQLCRWVSPLEPVTTGSPNARWHAFQRLAPAYRAHLDERHPRPAPLRVQFY